MSLSTRILSSLVALAAVTIGLTPPPAHAAIEPPNGCFTGTEYSSVQNGWRSARVRGMADGYAHVLNSYDGVSVVVYPLCSGQGVVMFRFEKRAGIWRTTGKASLRATAVDTVPAARTTLSLPAPGCFAPADYERIQIGWWIGRAENIAEGPAYSSWGDGSIDVRVYFACDGAGFVLLRTRYVDGSRRITGKTALFPR